MTRPRHEQRQSLLDADTLVSNWVGSSVRPTLIEAARSTAVASEQGLVALGRRVQVDSELEWAAMSSTQASAAVERIGAVLDDIASNESEGGDA